MGKRKICRWCRPSCLNFNWFYFWESETTEMTSLAFCRIPKVQYTKMFQKGSNKHFEYRLSQALYIVIKRSNFYPENIRHYKTQRNIVPENFLKTPWILKKDTLVPFEPYGRHRQWTCCSFQCSKDTFLLKW